MAKDNLPLLVQCCENRSEYQKAELYGVWNFWLRLYSCFGWTCSDSCFNPK